MDIGQLHVVILHFPIVLFWVAFVYDLLGAVWKVHVYPAGHWILIIGALLAIPTAITGLEASEQITNPNILIHRNLALATLAFALLHGAFRLRLILRKKKVHPYFLTLLSLITVILVSITAEYGGLIAFGKGLFS